MEQKSDVETTVYYVFPPFENNEEEISESFLLKDLAELSDKDADVVDFMDCDDELLNSDVQYETTVSNEEQLLNPPEDVTSKVVDRLTCKFCYQKFTKILTKQRHVKKVHNVSREIGAHMKCIECNVTFNRICKLREHLETKHNLNMSEEELCFSNKDAFKKWKHELEQKTLCSYNLRHGPTKGPKGHGRKYFYYCHRSGKYMRNVPSTGTRMLTQSTCRMGIVCTAAIMCQETSSEILVKYCPHHYGHGLETTVIHLSAEEQKVIAANLSKGIPFETVLDEIRDGQALKDHFQLYLLKKKYMNCINNAYDVKDFNKRISASENIAHWVSMCNQLKNSPILYHQQEKYNGSGKQQTTILIIMTEFQKHVLLSSPKKIFCIDSLYRKRSGRFYLTILFITDEDELAFPVAFCISDKLDKSIVTQFFRSICQSTGPLVATYFISDCDSFYYESWKDVMNDNAKWLWSMWSLDSRIRRRLNIFKGDAAKRADVYKTMRMLIECQNEIVFSNTLEKFIENLLSDPQSKNLGNFIKQNYASSPEIWAYCYRKDIRLSTNIHLEILHQVFKFCCSVGRKKRLDKFVFVIMKLLQNKMLSHLSSTNYDGRRQLMNHTISMSHNLSLEIPTDCISATSDKAWLVKSIGKAEEVFYVHQECMSCPENCNLRCSDCDICVHMYSCSCVYNMINADICQHIHAVVWNLFPHFPILFSSQNSSEATNIQSSNNLQSVLKKTCEVYKNIQKNKCNLSESSLAEIMKKMNECLDICSEEKVPEKTSVASSSNVVKLLSLNQPSVANPNALLSFNNLIEGNNSQSFTLPNQASTVISSCAPSQYVMLLPNNIVS